MRPEPSPNLSGKITGERPENGLVASMAGIGPKRAMALEARGIVTAADLIFHLPVRYQDWRERTPADDLRVGKMVVIEGDLGKITERPMRGSRWRRLASGWLDVQAKKIRVVWFNFAPYMRGYLPRDARGAPPVAGGAERDSGGLPPPVDSRPAFVREPGGARAASSRRLDSRGDSRRNSRRRAVGWRRAALSSRSGAGCRLRCVGARRIAWSSRARIRRAVCF